MNDLTHSLSTETGISGDGFSVQTQKSNQSCLCFVHKTTIFGQKMRKIPTSAPKIKLGAQAPNRHPMEIQRVTSFIKPC
jgi:hypothetical protein